MIRVPFFGGVWSYRYKCMVSDNFNLFMHKTVDK